MTALLFVVGHPTQFEAPFFAHVSNVAGEDALVVLFSEPDQVESISDHELARTIDWGFDLRGGYRSMVAPNGAGVAWAIGYLKATRPKYVIVNGYQIGLHRSVTAACHILGIPIGLRIDGALFATRSRWKQALKRVLYPFLNIVYRPIFSVGSVTDEYLLKLGVRRSGLARFTYAIDTNRFRMPDSQRRTGRESVRRRFGIPPDSTVVLSIAKFSAREAPWDLVAALPKLPSSEWTILLVGDGPDRTRIEGAVNAAGNAIRAIVPGYVPYPELPDLYAAADIFVHAATEEIWGVSVSEAMAAGLPVIASDRVGAARDLVISRVNGATYPLGNSDRLADLLNEVRSMLTRGMTFSEVNDRILQNWNYAATWDHIKEGMTRHRADHPGSGKMPNALG